MYYREVNADRDRGTKTSQWRKRNVDLIPSSRSCCISPSSNNPHGDIQMKKTTLLLSLAAVSAASLVWAHGGATGIVKERMDGMVAMSKATKAITPMMRGNVEYNAEAIREYARTIEEHAGEAMTKLFPEGSGGMPSEAKDDVWTDWEQFEVLAMQLESLGKGLGQAAENGLAASGSADGASTNMMGTGGMMGTGSMMGAGSMIDIEMLAQMPADAVFAKIGQACSACHTKFRAESN